MLQRRVKKRRGWLLSVCLSLVTVGLPFGLYLWGSASDTFAVRTVVLTGCERVPRAKAQRLLDQRLLGSNLFKVRGSQAEEALSSLLFVAEVHMDRDFPATLRVTVREHEPALYALWRGRWYIVSRKAVVLGAVQDESRQAREAVRTGPQRVSLRLPAVQAVSALKAHSVTTDANVRLALRVVAALPAELRSKATSLWNGSSGLRLRLRPDVAVDLGPATRLDAKGLALDAVLDYYRKQKVAARYVDVSVPDRPLAKPML